jgi:hypothetical protein
MDRRTTIKWVLAAATTLSALPRDAVPSRRATVGPQTVGGYGTDPRLTEPVHPGEFWPLTLSTAQRRSVAVLADLIIPADAHSPCASDVGVVDFIDEWISAPYPEQQADRIVILAGLGWLDSQAQRQGAHGFTDLPVADQHALCTAIASVQRATDSLREPAVFFARFRDLTAGGFYCTPAGRKDLNYIGNVALASFEGPDTELLRALGLA